MANRITCPGCGKGIVDVRRYPVGPLAQFMGLSENQACLALGMSGSTQQDARCHGVSRVVADRLARRVGEHPSAVWPEIIDHDFQDVTVPCEECGDRFVPSRKGHRFCSRQCQSRRKARDRYATDEAYREQRKAAAKAYHEECRDYSLAVKRRWHQAGGDELLARRREQYRERNEAERVRAKYATDPEFRERKLARNREWKRRQREAS